MQSCGFRKALKKTSSWTVESDETCISSETGRPIAVADHAVDAMAMVLFIFSPIFFGDDAVDAIRRLGRDAPGTDAATTFTLLFPAGFSLERLSV